MAKGSSNHLRPPGMKRNMPRNSGDPSRTCKGGSVDSDATRSSTAKTPPTLGPRTA